MKKIFIILSLLCLPLLTFEVYGSDSKTSNFVIAQAHMGDPNEKVVPKHGCQTIDVHCQCVNPSKNYTVRNQKVGRVNPGEPGQCRPKLDIDTFLKEDALGYCLREGGVKDPRKPQSKCTATWTCKEPCIIKNTP